MSERTERLVIIAGLALLSLILFVIHFLAFHDLQLIFIYTLQDIAFLPLEVLLVYLVLERVLSESEKRRILRKLNMVIGVFFSQIGINLINRFLVFLTNSEPLGKELAYREEWGKKQALAAARHALDYDYEFDYEQGDIIGLKEFLFKNKPLLVRIMENPIILEYESFSECLMAVLHLAEELEARTELTGIPAEDQKHLANDMVRAFRLLNKNWINYMRHLQIKYPYLFVFWVKHNPFRHAAGSGEKG